MKFNMQALREQFTGLNLRDPASWPPLPRVVALGVIVVATLGGAYLADWQSQLEELEVLEVDEARLKQDYLGKYRQAVNLELYKAQLVEVNVLLGNMLRQLPNKSQMEALITDINNAGLARGLQFELFKPASQETKKEVYAELPISIKVTGAYHDMGRFAADIGQLSRIVTLNEINIAPAGAAGGAPAAAAGVLTGQLTMEATARTYRYLDEAELQEARQAAAAKRKKPGSSS